jgi:hypothetical protein
LQREAEGNIEAFKARMQEATSRTESLAAELSAAGEKIAELEEDVQREGGVRAEEEPNALQAQGSEEKAILPIRLPRGDAEAGGAACPTFPSLDEALYLRERGASRRIESVARR